MFLVLFSMWLARLQHEWVVQWRMAWSLALAISIEHIPILALNSTVYDLLMMKSFHLNIISLFVLVLPWSVFMNDSISAISSYFRLIDNGTRANFFYTLNISLMSESLLLLFQADYKNLINIAAELVDSLESAVRGKMVRVLSSLSSIYTLWLRGVCFLNPCIDYQASSVSSKNSLIVWSRLYNNVVL